MKKSDSRAADSLKANSPPTKSILTVGSLESVLLK